METKNNQLAEKILKYILETNDARRSGVLILLDEAYPEPPDEVTPPYIIKDCDCVEKIRALNEQIDLLESQLAALKAEVIEAIKPFAEIAEYYWNHSPHFIVLNLFLLTWKQSKCIKVCDLRRIIEQYEKLTKTKVEWYKTVGRL